VEIIADERHRKMRLEDVLLAEFPRLSKMYLRERVKSGECEVNGRTENIGYRVRPQDYIEISVDRARGTAMQPEAIDLEIIHEDDDIIVVNKPAGMLMHPSHHEQSGTLINALAHHLNVGNMSVALRPGLPHRLDKQTSGLVVIAKHAAAHRKISAAFMKKRVEKKYLALLDGVVDGNSQTIVAPIGRFAERKLWGVKEDGKYSETRLVVRERFDSRTLVELEPVTGRTNQLRIHAAHIGHPIIGDEKRGGSPYYRLCLHAWRLSFPHPRSHEIVGFEAGVDYFAEPAAGRSSSTY
jgi:23S rRNA pseudouridine1911/1915/1917 synthase